MESKAIEQPSPVLSIRGLWKMFGSTVALHDVNIDIGRGEIHGLLGQNGSGKSTLIRVLAGFHAPDNVSKFEARGRAVHFPIDAREYRNHGWQFVHQDLGLIEDLTVLENFELVGFHHSGKFRVRTAVERKIAKEALERFDIPVMTTSLVSELTPSARAMVAIARAAEGIRLSGQGVQSLEDGVQGELSGLLVLDEPTTFLPDRESEQVFALIRRIAEFGGGVLFVSHRLSEVRAVCHSLTVLRDGRQVWNGTIEDLSDTDLVKLIVGSSVTPDSATEQPPIVNQISVSSMGDNNESEVPVIRVGDLTGGSVGPISFEISRSTFLGITGLIGSGYEEVLALLYGALKPLSGQISVGDYTVEASTMSPVLSRSLGLAYIPADRRGQGGCVDVSISENVSLPILEKYFTGFRLRGLMERQEANRKLVEFSVSTQDSKSLFGLLSGGNQQKVLLAKWLQVQPDVLLLSEPTQGLDVGARTQVLSLLKDISDSGTAVIIASADLDVIVAVCKEVLVMEQGRLGAKLEGPLVNREDLATAVYGVVGVPE